MLLAAIVTRYVGPTNKSPARVIARCKAGSAIQNYDHALSHEANHVKAAQELARRYGWEGNWSGGMKPGDDQHYVWVRVGVPDFRVEGGDE